MVSRRSFFAVALLSSRLRAAGDPLQKAMESVRASMPTAAADPERPVYHFHPPANWSNDPNGTIFYRGWHHLFYQFNPYGSSWGHMHWGHARSRDLVNWEHLPIALAPSVEKGETAVFSGGAILALDGRPRIFYTSIGERAPEQWMATPADEDLIVWTKSRQNPILTTAVHGALKVDDWRDPFLFTESGATYMVCGGNTSGRRWGGSGQVQLYRATNDELTHWTHLGPVFECRDREIVNIECPDLFKLDGKWVLIISPHKPCEYFLGSLDLARPRFTPEARGILDAGMDYASNISRDQSGRTILWMWGRTGNPAAKGWNSVMALPRILSLGSDGFLRQQPAPELEKLRGAIVTAAAVPLTSTPSVLQGIRGDCMELEIELTLGRAAWVRLNLRCSESGKAGAAITITNEGLLTVGKATTLLGQNDRYRLRVFLDKRVFEVYANGGLAALYSTTDAGRDDLGITVSVGGEGAEVVAVKGWPLKPAEFDASRFHV
ncbi:MAG: glycoside hydrolase family 32 protein [Candidatus Sulfopaludibacter sp.]|nr:glycoside hydrolase family 32 protein [Candidatus Sulfopaludibacter sp.]